jgi:hypothetical protein
MGFARWGCGRPSWKTPSRIESLTLKAGSWKSGRRGRGEAKVYPAIRVTVEGVPPATVGGLRRPAMLFPWRRGSSFVSSGDGWSIWALG